MTEFMMMLIFFMVIELVAKWLINVYWTTDWDKVNRSVAKFFVRVYDRITD